MANTTRKTQAGFNRAYRRMAIAGKFYVHLPFRIILEILIIRLFIQRLYLITRIQKHMEVASYIT